MREGCVTERDVPCIGESVRPSTHEALYENEEQETCSLGASLTASTQ
jgi:hypothetical protein